MRPRDIPKQYRIPRPMSAPGRGEHVFWRLVPLEALALALAVLLSVVAPLGGLDDALTARILGSIGSNQPLTSVISVELSALDVRTGACAKELGRVLSGSHARAAVLVHGAAELCPLGSAEPGLPAVAALPASMLRVDGRGRVLGFEEPPAEYRDALERAGVRASPWALPRQIASVPSVALSDLASGRVPQSVLRGRVVVVAAEAALGTHDPSALEVSLGSRVAGALGAVLEDGPRRYAPGYVSALFALIAAGAVALSYTRRGPARALGLACGVLALTLLGQVGYLLAGGAELLPLGSSALALGGCWGTLVLPRTVAKRRALRRATELLERAALIRTQSVHTIPDSEFWLRIAQLAGQAHPAEEVLVAELPPHHWHLRFWAGENLIGERRRDIRRTPYCNDQGVPTIRVVRNYLVVKDMPVLVVPLTAFGDVEGYVFLCGERAEAAFNADPRVAERLSRDLGTLLYRRRLGSLQENDWRRTAGALVRDPERRTAALIEGARVALDDLRLFGAVLREAPVPLVYADAFADVRVLGKAFARLLPGFGVPVPPGSADGPLGPGALSLVHLLGRLCEQPENAPSLASIAEKPEGVTCRTRPVEVGGITQIFDLTLKALVHESAGVSAVVGYVATLTEVVEARSMPGAVVERLPVSGGDPLSVVPMAKLLEQVVGTASRRAGRPIRLEPPRATLQAVLHRRVFAQALESFLIQSAEHSTSGNGPVVLLEERHHRVELTILDVRLGVPSGALKRALRAPGTPPEGLDVFARLVSAVQDSHGRATVKSNDGWGVTVTLQLVRARPPIPVDTGHPAEVVSIAKFSRQSTSES